MQSCSPHWLHTLAKMLLCISTNMFQQKVSIVTRLMTMIMALNAT